MIVDGERIKELVRGAKREVILCAPFIKKRVLAALMEAVPRGVPLSIVTRWRPPEVAAGLSDLEVFELTNDRPNTRLGLLYALHAKIYVADDSCLVGSANLTASALGWCPEPNLEILLSAPRSNADVVRLLERLASATPATFQIRAEVEQLAAALTTPSLDESREPYAHEAATLAAPWLPRCAAPDKLFAIYQNPESTIVVEGTRADARADLEDLFPPSGLSGADFVAYIGETLEQLPSFERILESIPSRLPDAQGARLISELRPDLSEVDVGRQWHIVREWIGVFYKDRFEVAPESYVIRLK